MNWWQIIGIAIGAIGLGAIVAVGILYYVLKDMYR